MNRGRRTLSFVSPGDLGDARDTGARRSRRGSLKSSGTLGSQTSSSGSSSSSDSEGEDGQDPPHRPLKAVGATHSSFFGMLDALPGAHRQYRRSSKSTGAAGAVSVNAHLFVPSEGREGTDFFHRLFPAHLNPYGANTEADETADASRHMSPSERSVGSAAGSRRLRRSRSGRSGSISSIFRTHQSLTVEADSSPVPELRSAKFSPLSDSDDDDDEDAHRFGATTNTHRLSISASEQSSVSDAVGATKDPRRAELDAYMDTVLARAAERQRGAAATQSLARDAPSRRKPHHQLRGDGAHGSAVVVPESALPSTLNPAQRTELRSIFAKLLHTEEVTLSATIVNAASLASGGAAHGALVGDAGKGPTGGIAVDSSTGSRSAMLSLQAAQQAMCRFLEALWERYRVAHAERARVREMHFMSVSRENFNAIASAVAKYSVSKAHGSHLHRLMHLREAALQSFLAAASDSVLADDSASEAEHDSAGVFLYNVAASLRHCTLAILKFVDFLRTATRLPPPPGGDHHHHHDGRGEAPSPHQNDTSKQQQQMKSKRRLRHATMLSLTATAGVDGGSGTGDPEWDTLPPEQRDEAVRILLDWEGQCYLTKMLRDTDALAKLPLGRILAKRGFVVTGNPLLVPTVARAAAFELSDTRSAAYCNAAGTPPTAKALAASAADSRHAATPQQQFLRSDASAAGGAAAGALRRDSLSSMRSGSTGKPPVSSSATNNVGEYGPGSVRPPRAATALSNGSSDEQPPRPSAAGGGSSSRPPSRLTGKAARPRTPMNSHGVARPPSAAASSGESQPLINTPAAASQGTHAGGMAAVRRALTPMPDAVCGDDGPSLTTILGTAKDAELRQRASTPGPGQGVAGREQRAVIAERTSIDAAMRPKLTALQIREAREGSPSPRGRTSPARSPSKSKHANQPSSSPPSAHPMGGGGSKLNESASGAAERRSFVRKREAEVVVLDDGEVNPQQRQERAPTERELYFESLQRRAVKAEKARQAKSVKRENTYSYPSQVYAPAPRPPTVVLASRLDSSLDPTFALPAEQDKINPERYGLDKAAVPPSIVDKLREDVAASSRQKAALMLAAATDATRDGGKTTGAAVAVDLPFTLAAPVAPVTLSALVQWHRYLVSQHDQLSATDRIAAQLARSQADPSLNPLTASDFSGLGGDFSLLTASAPNATTTDARARSAMNASAFGFRSGSSAAAAATTQDDSPSPQRRGGDAGGTCIQQMQSALHTGRDAAVKAMAGSGLSRMVVQMRQQHQQHQQESTPDADPALVAPASDDGATKTSATAVGPASSSDVGASSRHALSFQAGGLDSLDGMSDYSLGASLPMHRLAPSPQHKAALADDGGDGGDGPDGDDDDDGDMAQMALQLHGHRRRKNRGGARAAGDDGGDDGYL